MTRTIETSEDLLAARREALSKGVNFHFDMWAQAEAKANGHPEAIVKDLGITWEHSWCTPVADRWTFTNCQNVPDELPGFLERF